MNSIALAANASDERPTLAQNNQSLSAEMMRVTTSKDYSPPKYSRPIVAHGLERVAERDPTA